MHSAYPVTGARRAAAASLQLAALALLLTGCGLLGGGENLTEPTELTEITPQVQFKKLWSTRAGSGNGEKYMRLSPALSGDLLIVADTDGRVQGLDRSNGNVRWRSDLDTRLSGGVGAGSGLAVVGSPDGLVYALDVATGEPRWQARVSSEVLAPAVVTGDTVVVQSMDDHLHAFSATDGTSRWVFDNEVPILTLRGTSRPVILGDLVVAGFANGKVAGIDLQTGQLRWDYRVGIPHGESELERMVDIDGDLLLDGETVYAASYQGRVSAVHALTGVSRWDRDASSYQGLGAGLTSLFMADQDGIVEALDQRTAEVVWTQAGLKFRRVTAPVTIGDHVVVGDFEGYLHALSYRDGAFTGRTQLHNSGIRSRLLVDDGGVLYVMANDGQLAAYTLN